MKKSLFLGLLASAALWADGVNLVKNPSFEELDANGYPTHWVKPGNNWHGSDAAAYDGKRSALFDNDDPSQSRWLVQVLKLEPGKTYEYSAFMKVLMKPDAPKDAHKISAQIILEYTKNGTYSGGSYGCTKVSLNNEWIRLSGRAVIPENMDSATIGLLPSPRNSIHGQIWFDCVDIHEVDANIFACLPTTDCYRDEAADGIVTVICGRPAGKSPVPEEVYKASTLRIFQQDKQILEIPTQSVLPDRVTYQFDAATLQPGQYTLQCRLVNPADGKVHTSENLFKRLAQKPNYRVYVDKHRRMIVDGKPFFPLGMYHMKLTKENLQAYIDSDFNCLMPYEPPRDKEMLDYLQANNLKLIYANVHPSSRTKDKEKTRKVQERGYKTIDELKYHPAIIAWYINDEVPAEYLDDAIAYRRGCEEHDPDRPTWTVLCNGGEFLAYLPASDIHGSDPYPIPEGFISSAYKTARMSSRATLGAKMIMQVPQAFSWGRYWKKYGYTEERTSTCPMPSFEQMDAMAWMAIAGGANGLVFYSYFDMLLRDKEVPGLPAIPFAKSFGDIKKVATRIKDHENVLLATEKPLQLKSQPDPLAIVVFRTYCLDGVTWLLAVNTTADKPGPFELEFTQPVSLQGVSLSATAVKVDGAKISATLQPMQSIFIKLK